MADLVLTGQQNHSAARLIQRFKERFPAAIVRALNRSAVSARANMASNVAKDVGLKVGTVRDQITIQEATQAKFLARVAISGKRIPLIDFNARGPEPSRGRGRGVTARLPGGAGRYPHAFIARMRSGHRGVFQRVGAQSIGSLGPGASRRRSVGAWSPNLPIYELRGPSLPKVFTKHMPEGLRHAHESLIKNLRSEIRFAMSQQGQ